MRIFKTALIFAFGIWMISACGTKLTEAEYYTAAKEAYTNAKFDEALKNFTKLVDYYPDGKHAAEACFMLGFINANDLKNYDEARKHYNAFIEKFPDNDLTDDAQFELKTMGKDINELNIFPVNAAADSSKE